MKSPYLGASTFTMTPQRNHRLTMSLPSALAFPKPSIKFILQKCMGFPGTSSSYYNGALLVQVIV